MPRLEFFRQLGIFVLGEFLDAQSCTQIRLEMLEARSEKARIVGPAREEHGTLDESVRRVLYAEVPKPTRLLVKSKLAELKPKLQEHFQVLLTGCDGPYFLIYGPEGFYKPHRDDAGPFQRQVSVVILLNSAAETSGAENGYGGGALTFYGLLEGPKWEKCAFSLEGLPGLLIAFRPNVLHEVKPLTFGRRFTIAAWFTNQSSASGRQCDP